jgi:hypothetical protein
MLKKIPVGARFFAPVQTGPGAHPASGTMGTGSFPGINRPGRGADHPSPSSAEVENEYGYTSTPPLGHEACYRVNFTFLYTSLYYIAKIYVGYIYIYIYICRSFVFLSESTYPCIVTRFPLRV